MTRRDLLLSGLAAGAVLPMTTAETQAQSQAGAAPPRYTAIALQARCDAVNQDTSQDAARARMTSAIGRVSAMIASAKGFLSGFNGYETRLVVLPEYWMTGFPLGETREQWQDKAAIDPGGAEETLLMKMAQERRVFLCSNHYENDAKFPDLYFQANVIYAPNGSVALRYRRMISMYTPTPYDVWDRYLDAYGYEGVFPVAHTEIGSLGAIASEEILYPEIARMFALRGAEILLHPTSEVGAPGKTPKHIAKMARAIENMAYVVSANSAGIYGTPLAANATDAMSIVIDWYGRTLAEAGAGETFNANAVLDVGELRDMRRRTGMTNLLSRLPLDAFERTYASTNLAPPNKTPDGRMIERAQVIAKQRDLIDRLVRDGIYR